MKSDLINMLRNAAPYLNGTGYGHDLEQLAKNLQELYDRWSDGDADVVREFFTVYVMHKTKVEA